MKKVIALCVSLIMVFAITACSNGGDSYAQNSRPPRSNDTNISTPSAADASSAESPGESGADENNEAVKILIAYFTMPQSDGVDAVSSASRLIVDGEVVGNTQFIAQIIQESTGGDLFAIKTVQEYPRNYDALIDQAADEQDESARPELSTQIDNIDDYAVIFLGYPNWWYDLPMPLYTFLEEYDLSGKTIVPFCTHGGSSFSDTINTISELQPNATVIEDGFKVSRNNVSESENNVVEWIKGLNLQQ